MNIEAIVFDIGGVLEITRPTGWKKRWEARLNLAPGELDERLKEVWHQGSLGQLTETQAERKTAELLELGPEALSEFYRDLWDDYLGTPNVALIQLMHELRPQFKVGILSDSFVGARERESQLYRFPELCDVLVYSHEVGLLKPDPRIYQLTQERLGVEPSRILFLDDSDYKVEGARKVGWNAILYLNATDAICEVNRALGRELSYHL